MVPEECDAGRERSITKMGYESLQMFLEVDLRGRSIAEPVLNEPSVGEHARVINHLSFFVLSNASLCYSLRLSARCRCSLKTTEWMSRGKDRGKNPSRCIFGCLMSWRSGV